MKLAINQSLAFDVIDQLRSTCSQQMPCCPSSPAIFVAAPSTLLQHVQCARRTHMCLTLGQNEFQQLVEVAHTQGPSLNNISPDLQSRLGTRERCGVFNDKGSCFRGKRCPYDHLCSSCGGPHQRVGCPLHGS